MAHETSTSNKNASTAAQPSLSTTITRMASGDELPVLLAQKRREQHEFLQQLTPARPTPEAPRRSKLPAMPMTSFATAPGTGARSSGPSTLYHALQTDTHINKRKRAATSSNTRRDWQTDITMATMQVAKRGTDTVLVNPPSNTLRKRSASTMAAPYHAPKRSNAIAEVGRSHSTGHSLQNKPVFKKADNDFTDPIGAVKVTAPRNLPASKKGTLGAAISARPQVEYSPEQKKVLERVVDYGESVFFTGSAGTGKSLLLREIIHRLRDKFTANSAVAVTASTGIAACNINGCTLHSFAGVGLANGSVHQLVTKVRKSRPTFQRWQNVRVLVIDEISMVDGEFFDKLNAIAKAVRASLKPFGGIQLVICGDYFQLPPVSHDGNIQFCFETASWTEGVKHTYHLKHVYRQRDNAFVNMLNELRIGKIKPASEKLFYRLQRTPKYPDDGIMPTRLYSRRHEVETANAEELGNLPGPLHRFLATDSGKDKVQVERLPQNCLAPTVLELKLNAQVILLKNVDTSLVNGSLGRVIDFKLSSDEKDVPSDILWPLVRFQNGREMIVTPNVWSIEVPGEGEVARREQVPLLLSWALSIHKSQGQTLERVVVDLRGVFEKGQAYVALSRATSLAGIQVLGFHPSKVMAHPRVITYYESLS